MDHDVILPNGEINYNPFRAMKNVKRSEVILTVYHVSRMSEEEYKSDIQVVKTDLNKLKSNLERKIKEDLWN